MLFVLPLLALVVFGVILGRTGVSGWLLIGLGVVTVIVSLALGSPPDEGPTEPSLPSEPIEDPEWGPENGRRDWGLVGFILGTSLVVVGFVVLLVRSGGPDGAQNRDEGVQPEQLEEGGPQEDGQVGEDDKSVPPESNR